MHRRLLLLLVAALFLRAWVGEAMAGQMLVQQLQGAGAAVTAAQALPLHGPDCPGMAADDTASAAAAVLHCQDCTLHALPAGALVLPHALPSAHVPSVPRRLAGIAAQPGYKPPIA
jgi:hypothetical protein